MSIFHVGGKIDGGEFDEIERMVAKLMVANLMGGEIAYIHFHYI